MPDLFASLLPMAWRGQQFPVTNFRTSLSQDLAEHRFSERDGAHLEATGRAPLIFSARILFRNGIKGGPNENLGVLYPDGWRLFLKNAADKTSGTFQHPELGAYTCKLKSAETVWSADVRDGVDVDATWVESTDDNEDLTAALKRSSPITEVSLSAEELDDNFVTVAADLTEDEQKDFLESFTDAVNAIQSVADTASMVQRKIGGKFDALFYRCELLYESMSRAASPQRNWPAKRAANRMMAMLGDAQRDIQRASRTVSIYVTPKQMTVATVAAVLSQSVNDIAILNPRLLSKPVISQGSRVRYYQSLTASVG